MAVGDLYINEILANPGSDDTDEYIELRGAANATVANGTYLVGLESRAESSTISDSNNNPGDIRFVFDLSGMTLGSNGFLVLLQNGNPYQVGGSTNPVDPNASVVTSAGVGFDIGPRASTSGTPDLSGDGIFEHDFEVVATNRGPLSGVQSLSDTSITFMLIEAPTKPEPRNPSGTDPNTQANFYINDVDANNDGILDGEAASWTVLDSVGMIRFLSGVTTQVAYGQINFVEDNISITAPLATTNITSLTSRVDYVGRNGNSTGHAANDWVGGDLESTVTAPSPNYTLEDTSLNEVHPAILIGAELDHIGSANFITTASPTVDTNTGSTIAEGGLDTIVVAELETNDTDSTDANLTYTLDSAPTDGTLFLDLNLNNAVNGGEALNAGSTFTQQNIAAGQLKYLHGGAENPTDSFQFDVSDETANSVNNQTFTFTVTPVNDAPVIANVDGDTRTYLEAFNGAPLTLQTDTAATVTDADNGNLNGGSITFDIQGATLAEDQLSLPNEGNNPGEVAIIGADVFVAGVQIGTITSNGVNGAPLTVSFTSADATLARVSTLIQKVQYANSGGDNPTGGVRNIDVTVSDGAATSLASTIALTISTDDDPATAISDGFRTDEATAIGAGLNVFDANPTTPDSDPDSPLVVTMVNGSAGDIGTQITLASQALLTLNSDGTFAYDPNGAFDSIAAAGSGATTTQGGDSFTYMVNGVGPATVTITIDGLDSDGDILIGHAGTPRLIGGIGGDTLDGSGVTAYASYETAEMRVVADLLGRFTNTGDAAGDTYTSIEGLIGSIRADQLFGTDDGDLLQGYNGTDLLGGRGGSDTLYGAAGNDTIVGGAGDDELYGGADNDLLLGQGGADLLFGGGGMDTFRFDAVSDSPAGVGNRDSILDFALGQDLIDLSRVDADSGTGGDQAFTYIGNTPFTNTAGQLRFSPALLQGDVDGDGVADFELSVGGLAGQPLGLADFIL